jgi:hypothetical protein
MNTYNVQDCQNVQNEQYLIQAFISGIPDFMDNTLELIANNPTLVSPSIIDAIAFRVCCGSYHTPCLHALLFDCGIDGMLKAYQLITEDPSLLMYINTHDEWERYIYVHMLFMNTHIPHRVNTHIPHHRIQHSRYCHI